MATKKLKLGRGLDELLGLGSKPDAQEDGELRQLPIEKLKPGRYQPRAVMDPDRLSELADSIRAQGLIQPIVVRASAGGGYEIIAGERRWRAAQQAGLSNVPCVVREADDRATVAMALIENIQREDLNPLEEAAALQRLIDQFDLTHQQAAEAVGRSRAAVSNLLRLLELPAEIRRLVETGGLEMGHARALLTLPEARAIALAREASTKGWSVRELEQRARAAARAPGKPGRKAPRADPDVQRLEQELGEKLGTRVAIQQGRGGRGKLVLHYHSLDELDGILARIG
jgi:ParB family transcriptional regulator, chromosome partitioning protein